MKQLLKKGLRRLGYDLVRYPPAREDLSEQARKIIMRARPFTMTSIDRLAGVIDAVTYITKNSIPGDIAECGVWRGGSMIATALTLMAHGDTTRALYLYDTYEGMPAPGDDDKSLDGVSAAEQLKRDTPGTGVWCRATLDDVRTNLLSTGYPEGKLHFIKGKVEHTIPQVAPARLALLRLDTDWYESTKHELTHLYPRLVKNGILIIDDYGHWQGARKAVDEYFETHPEKIYMHRLDYAGRMVVKT